MTFCCKLLALTAGLPVVAAAADPDMMNLVMPDASVVIEINVSRIMASPIGTAIKEAFHQGVASQLKTQLGKTQPQFQEQIAALTNIDWSREVQDILIAGGTSKSAPMLMIVRSSLNPARLKALNAFAGNTTDYEGVPILVSSKPGDGAIAFFDNSILAIGKMPDVESAIRRRSHRPVLPPALAAQVAEYGQYDIWVATSGAFTAPLSGPAAASPAGAQAAQYLEKVAGFNGGLRFSPDFDLSADIEARDDKGAAEMASGLRWLSSAVQSQAKSTGTKGLDKLKFQMNGKHILLSLHVPEEEIRAGLQQMRTAQAARPTLTASPALVVSPSSGLPPPPPGTIRVQSSEGTVLIPVEKQQKP